MTSESNFYTVFTFYGIIIAGIGGTIALVSKLWTSLVCKGKNDENRERRIELLESNQHNMLDELQRLNEQVNENKEAMHTMKEEGLKELGNIKASLARLEEALNK